jgi:hypothetical protein
MTAVAGVLVLCGSLFAQGNAGRILGTVTDQTGGALPGAMVSVIDVQRGVTRTLTTDDAGSYNAPNLLPGAYTVSGEFKGFKTAERTGFTLEVNQDLRVDLQLQPGEQSEKITVTGEMPLVETTNATLGGTIENAAINDLPLNGRNFENLLALRPGVTIYPGGGGWTQSTNGLRAHDNVYLVDGVNSDEPWMGQSVMNAGMAAGDAGTLLSVDAIDQFRTEINPKAEYGWKPGAIVSVGIKSGTNSMHGSAFAFGRGNSMDARDYFNPTYIGPVSPLNFEQFGATEGGPIKKDKIFYFLSFEEQRYTVGNPAGHSGVPTLSSLEAACTTAKAAGPVAALSLQLAGLSSTCAPLANAPGLFAPSVSVSDVNSTNKIDAGMVKADYHINQNNSLNAMYFISPGNGLLVDNPLREFAPYQLTNQYARAQSAAVNWTWTKSSTMVNEVRVGYSHYYQTFLSSDSTQNPANYSFGGSTYHLFTGQTNPAYFGLPQIEFSDSAFTIGASWPKTVGPDGVLQLVDHVSVLHGNHAFKFGGEVLANESTNNVTSNAKGPLRFNDPTAFFEGIPNRANFLSGNLLRHMSNSGFAAFLQDDWRVKPRLMVNLGIRYELDTVMKESDGLLGNFDPNSATGLVQIGSGMTSPYNGDHNNFAPRVGLAWDIQGNGKTVVRAGGGMMYEQFTYDMFNAIGNLLGLRMVPTGVALYANGKQIASPGSINVANISFVGSALTSTTTPGAVAFDWLNNGPSTPLYSAAPACGDGTVTLSNGFTPQPCSILGVNRNLRNPYVTNWNLDLQRAITNTLSLEIGYVGNHGTKLVGLNDVNETPLSGGPGQFTTKFPYLAAIDILSNEDSSNYNALQATLSGRSYHGLSFTAGYTYAHALDMNSDNWSFVIPVGSEHSLYGNSTFDIRQKANISLTYDLPGKKGFGQMLEGWQVNSIVAFQTGLPWSAEDLSDNFSGTNETKLNSCCSFGEAWNFSGNPADFDPVHGWTKTNGDILQGGTGGIPYYTFTPGFSDTDPAHQSPQYIQCAKYEESQYSGALQSSAIGNLESVGCYVVGNSLLAPPASGTLGNAGRNIFRDGGFRNWDFSVFKTFQFRERLKATFRVEAFNILNHPSFSNPGGPGGGAGTTDPSAGAGFGCGCVTPDTGGSNPILGSGGPRAIQLGLKMNW